MIFVSGKIYYDYLLMIISYIEFGFEFLIFLGFLFQN